MIGERMRLLLDMNLAPSVAEWLRGQGHDAVHVRDLGLGDREDVEIFARAAADNRIIVTSDLDFGEILAASQHRETSVIVLRLRAMHPSKVIARLPTVLANAEAALHAGAVVIVDEARLRIRRLPLGGC